ncbi:MAG: sterol desaturase family protein, partial [Myxococcota bacterium]
MNQADLGEVALSTTLFVVALTLFSIGAGIVQEALARKLNRVIFDLPVPKGQRRHEAIGTGVFWIIFIPSSIGTWWWMLDFTAGWQAEVVTFVVCLVEFQVFYYMMHRALHTKALYRFHKWHHRTHIMTPIAGLSMSPVEAIGWTVGILTPAVALSWFGALGAWGFLAYLLVHFYTNITGHANADFAPKGPAKALNANSVTYHALHHARYTGHYGFISRYMDVIGGTQFPDWVRVRDRIMDGQPLTKMG